MHQIHYIYSILEKFEINKYSKLSNMLYYNDEKLKNKKFDSIKHIQTIGCLLYLETGTRPNIIFETCKASRKNKNPTYED